VPVVVFEKARNQFRNLRTGETGLEQVNEHPKSESILLVQTVPETVLAGISFAHFTRLWFRR